MVNIGYILLAIFVHPGTGKRVGVVHRSVARRLEVSNVLLVAGIADHGNALFVYGKKK